MIDCVVFSIIMSQEMLKLDIEFYEFLLSDGCIHVYDSLQGTFNNSHMRQALFLYSILLPYFLERSDLYDEKGIEKFDMEIFLIHLVDDLSAQVN